MTDQPPQQFVAYPRPQYGKLAQLTALVEGYSGFTRVFLIYVVTVWVIYGFSAGSGVNLRPVNILVIILAIVFGSKYVGMVGEGMGWSKRKTGTARVLMALNFFLCGLIGYAIFQRIMADELRRYGIRPGFLGPKKADVADAMAKLQATG